MFKLFPVCPLPQEIEGTVPKGILSGFGNLNKFRTNGSTTNTRIKSIDSRAIKVHLLSICVLVSSLSKTSIQQKELFWFEIRHYLSIVYET